jgi:CRISPR-associated protein Csx10
VEGTIKVVFTSDWAIGSGQGRVGGIDRTIRRDADGLPFVPAKTLTGVLRDAAERVASILDGDTSKSCKSWDGWVLEVFGGLRSGDAPAPARLSIRPALLTGGVRAVLLADPALREAATRIKPAVRIDEASGRALDDHLRFEEHATSGLELVAPFTLDLSGLGQGRTEPIDLLVLAAAEVRAIGAGRRRGAGRCRVTVELPSTGPSVALEEVLRRLCPHQAPAEGELQAVSSPSAVAAGTMAGTSPGTTGSATTNPGAIDSAWRIVVRTITPVLVPVRTTGNVVRSSTCLPGRVLLPALLTALGHPAQAVDAVRSDALVVTAATPIADGEPTRPVPTVLAGPKSGLPRPGDQLTNTLRRTAPAGTRPVRNCYVRWCDTGVRIVSPSLVSTTHSVIDDAAQRPTSEVGGVFTTEAIAAGTPLAFEVRASRQLLNGLQLANLKGRELRVGRSKKDDYGALRVESVTEVSSDGAELCSDGADGQPAAQSAAGDGEHEAGDGGHKLLVWLVSDLLLRDHKLRPTTDLAAVAEALSEALEVCVTVPIEGAFVGGTVSRIEGWRGRWQLPHHSHVGLAAGTVLRFTVQQQPTPAKVAQLHRHGIGERRAEGFGQVVVNDPVLTESETILVVGDETAQTAAGCTTTHDGRVPDDVGQVLDDGARALLVRVARESLRRQATGIARVRRDRVADDLLPKELSASQLGRFRRAAARLTGTNPGDALRRLRTLANEHHAKRLQELLEEPQQAIFALLAPDASTEPEPSSRATAHEEVWQAARAQVWPWVLQAVLIEAIRHRMETIVSPNEEADDRAGAR